MEEENEISAPDSRLKSSVEIIFNVSNTKGLNSPVSTARPFQAFSDLFPTTKLKYPLVGNNYPNLKPKQFTLLLASNKNLNIGYLLFS